jgi:hypothetical protein
MFTVKLQHTLMTETIQGMPKAAASAVNKIAARAKTKMSEEVRERYNIKKGDFDETMGIIRATPSNLVAVLTSKSKPLAVTKYKASYRRKDAGAAVEIKRGQRNIIAGSFIPMNKSNAYVTMKSGHLGVFKRVGKSSLPIRELTGPAPTKLFSAKSVTKNVFDFVQQIFPDVFAKEFAYYATRKNK